MIHDKIHEIQLWLQNVAYLEAKHQVVKLEQIVKVQLESNWIQLYETNKQNSISIRYTTYDFVFYRHTQQNTLIWSR